MWQLIALELHYNRTCGNVAADCFGTALHLNMWQLIALELHYTRTCGS
jgi:hypothetical protein